MSTIAEPSTELARLTPLDTPSRAEQPADWVAPAPQSLGRRLIERFTLVAFPIFIALALVASRPSHERAVAGVSAIWAGVAVMQWALWQFVS